MKLTRHCLEFFEREERIVRLRAPNGRNLFFLELEGESRPLKGKWGIPVSATMAGEPHL